MIVGYGTIATAASSQYGYRVGVDNVASGDLFATNGGGALLDLVAFKLDSNGNWVWGRQFVPSFSPYILDASGDDQIEMMVVTSEGGMAIIGQSTGSFTSANQGFEDGFVIHLDKNGNL